MMMKRLMYGFASLSLLILIAGCNSSNKMTNQSANPLIANEWKLINIGDMEVPNSSEAGLLFQADNKVFGSTGCNRLNGTFEAKGKNSLQFSPLATTRMSCMEDNKGDIERNFIDALARTKNWSISNGYLTLSNDDNTLLARLKAILPESKSTGLNGGWELNYITGPKITFEGLYPEKKPTIIFNLSDSIASGTSSCNSYSVPVEINGNKIRFGEGLATLMACEGDGEIVYMQTLKQINSYKINEDNTTLELIKDGVPMMRFTRK